MTSMQHLFVGRFRRKKQYGRHTASESKEQTRIVLIVQGFPRLSETFIVNKFLGLLTSGWDAHVVCGSINPNEWAKFSNLKGRPDLKRRVHSTWPSNTHWLALLLSPIVMTLCLLRNPAGTFRYLVLGWHLFGADVLRRFYLDATLISLSPALTHFEFGTLAVGRTYITALLGTKVVVSFRGYDLNYVGIEQSGYYQDVWEKTNALHFLGEDLWQRAQRRGCPQWKPHVLIPPAIDTSIFKPGERVWPEVIGTRERPMRILSVGRLEWKKGYDYGLEAISLLKACDITCDYCIVGEGSSLEAVAFARHQFGLEDEVRLVGAKSRSEILTHLAWADVFLHSAVSEGFCNAVLEAQAMQLPVVCSDADGLADNVEHQITGFVVPRRNPQAIAVALDRCRDSAMRERMGHAARRRVLAHFQVNDQIARFDHLYRQVLGVNETVTEHVAEEATEYLRTPIADKRNG